MKNIAFIYSGAETNLQPLSYSRNAIETILFLQEKWDKPINKQLLSLDKFEEDLKSFTDEDIDELFFYFIGHGTYMGEEQTFYLQLIDEKKRNVQDIFNTIFNTLDIIPMRVSFVFDACFSGKIAFQTNRWKGIEIVTSSLGGELSSAKSPDKKRTLFTYHFCKAIENGKKYLDEISSYINGKVDSQESLHDSIIGREGKMFIANKTDIKTEQPPKDQKLFLTIQLHPSEKEYFKITIWAKSDDGTYLKNIAVEDTPLHKTKIAQYIDDCIEKRYRDISSEDIYLIFVMPSDLMTENINAWKLDRDRELGTEYTILMRGLERFSSEGENFHNKLYRLRDWEKNWEHCDTKGKQSLCNVYQIVTSNERVSKIPSKQIARTPFIILKYGVDSHTFITLYQSHISIALWINDCTDYEKFEQLFHKYSTYNLNELLENIDELQPYSSKLEGNAMLLYDNPDDVPPDEIEKRNAKTPKG